LVALTFTKQSDSAYGKACLIRVCASASRAFTRLDPWF
jgi:hypothetical protein